MDVATNSYIAPILLGGTYFPSHDENRMQFEGQLAQARERFLKDRPSILNHLLHNRFSWMNKFLDGKECVYEVGCGTGLSKFYINNPNLKLTDYDRHPWVDEQVDALNPPWAPNSVDAIVSSHMIHHLASPVAFFSAMQRVLRPGGLLVIQEINTALFLRVLLRMMRHEGWSYDIDVFDPSVVANDPVDPWSANCAIPELLFTNEQEFERRVPTFKIVKNELVESMLMPLSGGVVARVPFPWFSLSERSLSFVDKIDRALISLAPKLFAFGRSVVLEKR